MTKENNTNPNTMGDITYTRCKNCSYVFDVSIGTCPKCQKPVSINEDFNSEPVFNLTD